MKLPLLHFVSLLFLFTTNLFAQFDAETPMPVVNIGHQYPIIQEKFGHVSNRLLTLDDHGILKVWDVESGGNISTISSPSGKIVSAEFSMKDNWIIAKTVNKEIRDLDGMETNNTLVFKASTGELELDGNGNTISITDDENWIYSLTKPTYGNFGSEDNFVLGKYNLHTYKMKRETLYGVPLNVVNGYLVYYAKGQFVLLNILTKEKSTIAMDNGFNNSLTICSIQETNNGLILFCGLEKENISSYNILDSAILIRDSMVVIAKSNPAWKGFDYEEHLNERVTVPNQTKVVVKRKSGEIDSALTKKFNEHDSIIHDEFVYVDFVKHPLYAYKFKTKDSKRHNYLVLTNSTYSQARIDSLNNKIAFIENGQPGISSRGIDSLYSFAIDENGGLVSITLNKSEKIVRGKVEQPYSTYDSNKRALVNHLPQCKIDSIGWLQTKMEAAHSEYARLISNPNLKFSAIIDSTSISIHDCSSGVFLRHLGVNPLPIISYTCSQSRERLFLVLPNSTIRIYNFKLLDVEFQFRFPKESIQCIYPNFDGTKYLLRFQDSLWAYQIGNVNSNKQFSIHDPEAESYIGMPLCYIENFDSLPFVFNNMGSLPPVDYSYKSQNEFNFLRNIADSHFGISSNSSGYEYVTYTYSGDHHFIAQFVMDGGNLLRMKIVGNSDYQRIIIDSTRISKGVKSISEIEPSDFEWELSNSTLDQDGVTIEKRDICFSKDLRFVVVDNSETPKQNEPSNVLTDLQNVLSVYEVYPKSYWYEIKLKGPVDTMFIDSSDCHLIVLYKNSWGYPSDVFSLDHKKNESYNSIDWKYNSPYANKGLVTVRQNDFTLEMQAIGAINKVRTSGWIYNTTETVYFLMPCDYYHVDKDNLDAMSFRYHGEFTPIEKYDVYFNNPAHIINDHLMFNDSTLLSIYKLGYSKRLAKAGIKDQGPFRVYNTKIKGGYWANSGPKIIIENKNEIPVAINGSLVSIKFFIKDSLSPIASYSIKINGIPIWGAKGKIISPNKETFSSIETIQLTPGMNRIEVAAKDTNGIQGTSQQLFVNYTPKQNMLPRLFFVGIGVSDYKDSTYKLNYAAKDVRDMATMFSKSKSYSAVSIDTLLNNNATLENILAVKKHLLQSRPEDVVILYVSGHGLLDDSLDFFYATYDVDFAHPSTRGISFNTLEEILDSIPARQKLMLMDACHSGEMDKDMFALMNSKNSLAVGGKGVVMPQTTERGVYKVANPAGENAYRKYQLIGDMFVNFSPGTGTTVISASSGYGFALESPEWNNGVFTYCFINALQNQKADADKNGEVSVKELKIYLQQNVESLTDGKQKPNIRKEVLENDWRVY